LRCFLLRSGPGCRRERISPSCPSARIEQHGPHLFLGTDGFSAQALAQEIGSLTGGAVLPPVPFSWVGCTNVFSGGIGVRESIFIEIPEERW